MTYQLTSINFDVTFDIGFGLGFWFHVKRSLVNLKNNHDIKTPTRFWPKGLKPYLFQLEAVKFSLLRKATYLALEPGLGKTITAALILNRLNQKEPWVAVYVCPPFLTTNTEAEFLKWGVARDRFLLLPDSMLSNQDDLFDFECFLNFKAKKILFVDEAHRFKNEKTNRSLSLFKMAGRFDRVVFLSGTPMPNSRPVELWPILKRFAPDVFGTNFFSYGKKYCGAYHNGYGWSFDGFTNRSEFKARITRTFMLRLKKDVLTLPDKTEGLLTVGDGIPPTISAVEKKVLAHFTKKDLVAGEIKKSLGKGALHLSEYLKHLGEYKLKYVFPYIDNLLGTTNENILIFAHHKHVISELTQLLCNYKPIVITGQTPKEKRQDLVFRYQNDMQRRVFIGNIQACGVGFTLTKATRVLFIEFSWRDGDNIQAADRAHRIGQGKNVLVQYVVLKDSFDRKRMEIVLEKRRLAV